jgi:hypothetical protein
VQNLFSEVKGFLKMLTHRQIRLAAETRLGDGKFLQATEKREEFLKLRRRTLILVISKYRGRILNLRKQK